MSHKPIPRRNGNIAKPAKLHHLADVSVSKQRVPERRVWVIVAYSISMFLATSGAAKTRLQKHATHTAKKRPAAKVQMQTQPSAQRVAEIQAALQAHGYEPGATWDETQEICRKIADQHMWQTDHAPDARVLILLGLAGPHSDPAVTKRSGGRLDKDQRAEAARESQSLARR